MYPISIYGDVIPAYFGDSSGTYVELQVIIMEMIKWLQTSLGTMDYAFSDDTFWNRSPDTLPLPRIIFIMNDEDVVAFKIRFGV